MASCKETMMNASQIGVVELAWFLTNKKATIQHSASIFGNQKTAMQTTASNKELSNMQDHITILARHATDAY